MKLPGTLAQFVDRFDGDDAMAHRREGRRIAAGAGANVEQARRNLRDQVPDRAVEVLDRDRLVRLEQLGRFPGVACRAVAHSIGSSAARVALPSTTGTTSNSTSSCQSAIQRWNSVTSSASMRWKQRLKSALT